MEPILTNFQDDGGHVQNGSDPVREHKPMFVQERAEEALL